MWKVRAGRCRREDAVARARRVTSSRCLKLRRTTESSAPTAWDVCRRPRFLSLSCLIKRTSSSSAISVAQRARAGSRLGFNRANHCTFFRLTWLSGSSEVAGQGSRLLTAIFFWFFWNYGTVDRTRLFQPLADARAPLRPSLDDAAIHSPFNAGHRPDMFPGRAAMRPGQA